VTLNEGFLLVQSVDG